MLIYVLDVGATREVKEAEGKIVGNLEAGKKFTLPANTKLWLPRDVIMILQLKGIQSEEAGDPTLEK